MPAVSVASCPSSMPLLSGKINKCSVYWHTRLREKGANAQDNAIEPDDDKIEHGEQRRKEL